MAEPTCTRIQARAIRRCGGLLKKIDKAHGAGGGRPRKDGSKHTPGAQGKFSRTAAARAARLSPWQQETAMKVASVPKRDFERQVESR